MEKLSYLGVVLPNFASVGALAGRQASTEVSVCNGDLCAQWHLSWPTDPALHASWDQLVSLQSGATTFHSRAWQEALARPYIRAGRFRLLTITHVDGQLLAALPMQATGGGLLESIGANISDYLDPLVHPDHTVAVWDACMQALNSVPGTHIDCIKFSNIRSEYFNLQSFSSAVGDRFAMEAEETAMTARIPLQKTWDDYLATVDSHDRKELRRKLRNAETKADARFISAESESEVLEALDHVFDCMKQAGGAKGMKAQWTYRPMFRRAAPALVSAGRMKVYQLRLEGQLAAGLIAFPSAQGPQLWAAGFDQRFRQWSPGVVLFGKAIQQAIAEGAPYFDLLRGQQRYKSELRADYSPLFQVTLTRKAA